MIHLERDFGGYFVSYIEKTKEELIYELQELKKELDSLKISYQMSISKSMMAEEELEESREKYRGLSEAYFEAIFLSENGICISSKHVP